MTLVRLYYTAYFLGLSLFIGGVGLGTMQSIRLSGHLPPVESTFDVYIDELIRTGEHDRAIREIRMALGHYGSNRHLAYNSLGRVLAIHGTALAMQGMRQEALDKFQQAEAEFQYAMQSKPDYPDPYNNLGTLYLNLGSLQQSEAYFHRAIELAPGYAVAHHNLGRLYAKQGDLSRALGHLERAAFLSPDSEEMRRDLSSAEQLLRNQR